MSEIVTFDENSKIIRVKILDSTSTTGAGKTGLAYNTTGLIISTIASSESAATTYTKAADHIEDITTLGTYAAPSASCCRFKEVDSTNHPGLYEIQLPDARYSVAGAKSLVVSILGASGMVPTDVHILLTGIDLQDSVPSVDVTYWNGAAVVSPAVSGSPVVTLGATQAAYTPAKAGDAMALVDDAITSAKYDESTAFPVKSADTGSTALARTGADSDTLKTLSDQIDGAALEATLTAIKGAGWSTETLAAIDALIDAVKAKSDLIPASPAAVGSAMTLTAAYDAAKSAAPAGAAMTLTAAYDAAKTAAAAGAKMDIVDAPNATGLAAIADAFLKRDWTSVTGEATRSVLNALRPLLNKWTSASGAGGYVVKKEDDSTTAWTGTLTVDENGNISGMDHD